MENGTAKAVENAMESRVSLYKGLQAVIRPPLIINLSTHKRIISGVCRGREKKLDITTSFRAQCFRLRMLMMKKQKGNQVYILRGLGALNAIRLNLF